MWAKIGAKAGMKTSKGRQEHEQRQARKRAEAAKNTSKGRQEKEQR
jgi:hypothetical protein